MAGRWTTQAVSFDRAKPAGNEVLGQIFGKKQVSREVAQQLSATSGIGADILKKLLPIVATMVLGTLAKKMGSGGGAMARRASPATEFGWWRRSVGRYPQGCSGWRWGQPGSAAAGPATPVHAGAAAGRGGSLGIFSATY